MSIESEKNLSGSRGEWEVFGDIYYDEYRRNFGEIIFNKNERLYFSDEQMFAMAEYCQKEKYPYNPQRVLPKNLVENTARALDFKQLGQIEFYTFCSGKTEKTQKTHADIDAAADGAIKFLNLDENGKIKISYVTLDIKMRDFTKEQLLWLPEHYGEMVQEERDIRTAEGKRRTADIVFPWPNGAEFGKINNPEQFDFISRFLIHGDKSRNLKGIIDIVKERSYNRISRLTNDELVKAHQFADAERLGYIRTVQDVLKNPQEKKTHEQKSANSGRRSRLRI